MFSVAPDRPIASATIAVLRAVDRVARALNLRYFVTGATARDIVLYGVFGVDTGRGTLDVDLAVALDTWRDFEALKARLGETGEFTTAEREPHRVLYHRNRGDRGHPVDLLPFGKIEDRPHEIAWPPDLSIVMNVAGNREALESAPEVEVEPGFVVRVASLPGLAILKLFAWVDRGVEDTRDAYDLATLLRSYGGAGNEDRLYGDESALLEAAGYNVDLASPRLLGRDVARIASRVAHEKALAVLDDAAVIERLVRDMAREFRGQEDPIQAARRMVVQFRTGLLEVEPRP